MTPMGERIGTCLTRSRNLPVIVAVAFLLGFIVTISEPDLQVLAGQVPAVPNMTLILSVACGVGAFLVIALLRMLFSMALPPLLVVCYTCLLYTSDPVPVHGDNGRGMDRPGPDCDLSGGLYHKKRECSERRENVMIRTEKGCGQIFKIYGVSETEVKDALKEILNQGSAVPVLSLIHI